jgi:hypothetical protein
MNMNLVRQIRRRLDGFLATPHQDRELRRKLASAPPVLVYQMGKVGSSSLKKSLAASWPGLTIQAHTMAEEKRHSSELEFVYQRVVLQNAPVFVISPVREPIGRNISAFFQNFERDAGFKYGESTPATDQLIRLFLHNYDHDAPLRWFDKNLKPVFDIDVFEHDFPSHGVQVLEHKNVRLLLMRCEEPDPVKESAVQNFLNMPRFRLQSRNIGAQKNYGEAYKTFKEAFTAPDWYLNKMYESRFFRHFYGSQRCYWTEKWTRKDVARSTAQLGSTAPVIREPLD